MTMAILFLSSVENCGGDYGWSGREEEVRSVLERCARKAAYKDVLVTGESHGLILMANLASLPFYSEDRREYDHGHLSPFLSEEL